MMQLSKWLCVLLTGVSLMAGMRAVPAIATTTTEMKSGAVSATASASRWWWQNPLPHGNSMLSVACPVARTCYAVGSGTIMVSHDGGQSWSITFNKPNGGIGALSCPDRLTCYALANTDASTTAITASKDGGVTWTQLWRGRRGLEHLTCPGTAVCYAIGQYFGKILMTRDGGRTWLTRASTIRPVDIACPNINVCYTPLGTSLITSPPPSVAVTTNGGMNWTVRPVGIPRGQSQLTSIRCVSAASCLVIGYGNPGAIDRPFALKTANGGLSWQRQDFPSNIYFRGDVLTCPTAAVCYLGGDNGVTQGVLVATRDGGHTWFHEKALPFVPLGMTCSGVTSCIAVGNGGSVVRTTTGWTGRVLETHNSAHGSIPHAIPALQAVTCASRSVCYAGGEYSALVKTVDGGNHWLSVKSFPLPAFRGAPITSLACPDPAVCYAGSYSSYPTRAFVLSTHDGGHSWSANPGPRWAVVTCPTRMTCYAGGLRGIMQVTVDGGRTWKRQQTPLTGKHYDIQHLVCPSPSKCYATAMGPSEPPPHPSSNLGAILSTDNGGQTWQRTLTDPFPFDLTCWTSQDCFALIAGDLVQETVPTLVTHDGGRTWNKQNILPPGFWHSATCVNQRTCYLAGRSGAIAVTEDGGRTWRQEQTPTFNELEAIHCIDPDTCHVVGQLSTILVRR